MNYFHVHFTMHLSREPNNGYLSTKQYGLPQSIDLEYVSLTISEVHSHFTIHLSRELNNSYFSTKQYCSLFNKSLKALSIIQSWITAY